MSEGLQAKRIEASAPGKLVLSGEYAVLDGAPAICMAVDRRVRVTVGPSAAGCHEVTAPGFSSARGQFRTKGSIIEWLQDRDDFRIVSHIWRAAQAKPAGHLSIVLDSNEFRDAGSGVKYGIGSSAALAVALSCAFAEAADGDTDITHVALEGHRQFQDGLGSGVDVACSSVGGLIEYEMESAIGRRIDWPDDLLLGVVWVGVPADTGEKIRQLREQPLKASRAALVLASRRLANVWASGDATAVLREYGDYISVLCEFDHDHQLGILSAGHRELADQAARDGVVYKPCGAGGGDTGVVLATDRQALESFMSSARKSGVQCLDMKLELDGARLEKDQS